SLHDSTVDAYMTPGDLGIGEETRKSRMLQRIERGRGKAHGLGTAKLSMPKVVEGLGDDGLLQRLRGHALLLMQVWEGGYEPVAVGGSPGDSRSMSRRASRMRRKSLTSATSLMRAV